MDENDKSGDNSTSLHSLVERSSQILEQLILTDGEITPDIEFAIAVNDREIAQKIDSYNFIIERLDNDADYFKSKADQFLKISKGCQKTKEKIRDRIKEIMQANGLTEIKGNDIRFKLVQSQPALVIDEAKLSNKWKVITYTPDKQRIKNEILAGQDIEGARLEPGIQLRTYINRKE